MSDDFSDLIVTGPDTLAGRYMRSFWHPIFRSQDLPLGRALPVEIMSERFTLYRGHGGEAHLVAFRCAHRGTQLSSGWVEGENIRCRYHGWMYDASGQCVEQPGEEGSFASKVRIRSYPVREYIGLVFAYLGSGDPPEFRRIPDFEEPGVVEVGPPEIWPCNFFNRMDNDPAHPSFTHRESLSRIGKVRPAVKSVTADEAEYGIRTSIDQRWFFSHRFMPNITHIRQEAGGRILGSREDQRSLLNDRLLFYMPVNDATCITFCADHVPLTGDEAEAYKHRRQEALELDTAPLNEVGEAILAGKMRLEDMDPCLSTYQSFWIEDYVTIVGQGRVADRAGERLGRIDAQNILMRKLWRRDMERVAEGQRPQAWPIARGVFEERAGESPPASV